jgi:hypothetical protein
LRLWVGGPKLHERASEEIARFADPLPSLPSATGLLHHGDEPIAFLGGSVG